MRIFVVVMALAWTLLAGPTLVRAAAAQSVAVDILVVQASRRSGSMDAKLKKQVKLTKQMEVAGFKSAKVTDSLNTKVEVGASVALQVLRAPKRLLKVSVKEVSNGTIKLTVGIKALQFEIDTEHKNGGTFVVAHPQGKEDALFLAVTPKLGASPPTKE